jgi:hypothetical protein
VAGNGVAHGDHFGFGGHVVLSRPEMIGIEFAHHV